MTDAAAGASLNIYQKLVEVRKGVLYLQKENQGHQFKYVSSSQTISALRENMDELGLLLVPSILEEHLHTKWANKDAGATEHMTELVVEFTWINAEKPEEKIVCRWYGQGLDTGEKGVGKALTYAEKYLLLKFFNIATDKDDPDAFQDKQDDKAAGTTKQSPPKASAPKAETKPPAPPILPPPEQVVDLDTFRSCMKTAGVKTDAILVKASIAAGYDITAIDQLGAEDLRTVYINHVSLLEQKRGQAEGKAA